MFVALCACRILYVECVNNTRCNPRSNINHRRLVSLPTFFSLLVEFANQKIVFNTLYIHITECHPMYFG